MRNALTMISISLVACGGPERAAGPDDPLGRPDDNPSESEGESDGSPEMTDSPRPARDGGGTSETRDGGSPPTAPDAGTPSPDAALPVDGGSPDSGTADTNGEIQIDNLNPPPPGSGEAAVANCNWCEEVTLTYQIDAASFLSPWCAASTSVPNVVSVVEQGVDIWNNGTGLALESRVEFAEADIGETPNVVISCGDAHAMCGSTSAIGCAFVAFSCANVLGQDETPAMLEMSFNFTATMLANTVAHELGHTMGLQHSNGTCGSGSWPACLDQGVMCCQIQNTLELSCVDQDVLFNAWGECSACCGCGIGDSTTCSSATVQSVCTEDECGCRNCEQQSCPSGQVCNGGSCATPSCPACQNWNGSACVAVSNGITCAADDNACTSDVCSAGACNHPQTVSCNSSPPAACIGSTRRVYSPTGTCNTTTGSCTYSFTDTVCQYGCASGACLPQPICTPNWSCGAWSACACGTQTRTCTDLNSCGTTTGRPAISQSCVITELCNGADDDCDGQVDEGFGLGISCDGSDGDLCMEGTTTCSGCSDTTGTTAEVCGGGDEDCDGLTDEDLSCGPVCGNGICEAGETCSSCNTDCGACPVNQCPSSGALECPTATSKRICGDYNGDGYLEWGSATTCPNSGACSTLEGCFHLETNPPVGTYTPSFTPNTSCMCSDMEGDDCSMEPADNCHALWRCKAASVSTSANTVVMQCMSAFGTGTLATLDVKVAVTGDSTPSCRQNNCVATRAFFPDAWPQGASSWTSPAVSIWITPTALRDASCGAVGRLYIITDGSGVLGQLTYFQPQTLAFTKVCD